MASKTVTQHGEVNWYDEELQLVVDKATRRGMEAIAARIDGQAKQNIVGNDQVDTGFMLNSIYFATTERSTYNAANPSGGYTDKAGNLVQRQIAPEAALPADFDALVAVGADYAVYQEMAQSFLFLAVQQVAAEAGGIMQTAAKEAGL